MNNTAKVTELPIVSRKRELQRQVRKPRKAIYKTDGIVFQVRQAFEPKNRLAAFLGAIVGGLVPLASYTIAHNEYNAAGPWYQIQVWIVAACLLFSATSVYQWGKLAFRSGVKAFGFVALMEGILICSRTEWLAVTCLVYLCAINAISTGCNMVVKEEK